ncbi:putative peptidoglycan muropeptide transporter SLC46 [Brevipalpus obovatus]|uniref:putative peptidoglycan muropeptide transporter SLC46 n=1 Tax=Brevipalpus obovatus TaxID=246614 RepID=UPI003D9F40F2
MSSDQQPDRRMSSEKSTDTSFSYRKVISLDIFCFLICFSIGFSDVSLNQIVQDKICLNNLKLPSDVCRNIQDHKDYVPQAIHIYGEVTLWKSYLGFINCFPGILIILFLGKWLDLKPRIRKYLLAIGSFGSFLGSLIVLHQLYCFEIVEIQTGVPKILYGAVFFACVFSLIASTSPPSHRMIRFGMIEFCFHGGNLSGILLGGLFLALDPWFGFGLQNHTGIFVVSGLINLIAAIWALVFIDAGESHTLVTSQIEEESTGKHEPQESHDKDRNLKQTLYEFFDIQNVIDMLRTCVKRRSNRMHLHLWLCFLAIVIFIFCFFGEATIAYQFTQLVYHWSSIYYSKASVLASMVPTVMGPIWAYTLKEWFHLTDTSCGMIGIVSAMLSFLVKGSILSPYAFYLSSIIGSFSSTFIPSIRSIISKSIDLNETGKVFTSLQCLETTAAMVNGFFYSLIFKSTADSSPGFVYLTIACIYMIPFLAVLWIDIDVRHEKKLKLKKKEEISGLISV